MHAFPFPCTHVHLTPAHADACAQLNFNPTITLIIVGKKHKSVFFPEASVAEGGQAPRHPNCPPGTVIDTVVTSPVEWDFYLCSHQGILGTSRPAHYNVLLDENNFTCVHRRRPPMFFR
jgi:eukaryotic translation initiation factor 2C